MARQPQPGQAGQVRIHFQGHATGPQPGQARVVPLLTQRLQEHAAGAAVDQFGEAGRALALVTEVIVPGMAELTRLAGDEHLQATDGLRYIVRHQGQAHRHRALAPEGRRELRQVQRRVTLQIHQQRRGIAAQPRRLAGTEQQ
ncbi:hypothetical protein D3C78_647430 [compost metagenome]